MGRLYKTGIRLGDAASVKRVMQRGLNKFDEGQLDAGELRAVAYFCQTYMQILEGVDLEEKLAALEEAAGNGQTTQQAAL